ncbi:MAG TPA: FeoA family protein [Candidatus Omnitrophota bacterium]|nr:FeoA family protein [Candidatus Omnitrophota bacterium]
MVDPSKNTVPLSLARLKRGQKAKIVEVVSGKEAARRLSSLGLRRGATIMKFSAFALYGPVTVKVGSTTLALGHSVAEKILVEPLSR